MIIKTLDEIKEKLPPKYTQQKYFFFAYNGPLKLFFHPCLKESQPITNYKLGMM
jgi:hypothetical protein